MASTTYKPMALQWAQRPSFHLPLFSWHTLTQQKSKRVFKPTVWKRYIDDVFSLWDVSKPDIETFNEEANSHHPTIKFTAEISDTEIVFLDTIIYKGTRFHEKSILDVKTHFKKTEMRCLQRE